MINIHGNSIRFSAIVVSALLTTLVYGASRYARVSPGGRAKKMEAAAVGEAPAASCPPVQAQMIYRFIAGVDTCMVPMSSGEMAGELNDPFGQMLIVNSAGHGPWPASIQDTMSALARATPALPAPKSFMVGEGSQIPSTLPDNNGNPIGRDASRDLRYVLTWGPSNGSPTIFLSGPGAFSGTLADFLQVISFDPKKNVYNYYQHINNADVGNPSVEGEPRTWSWAGDSTFARKPATQGQGCFQCHLNGGLNMKELTSPWNNWSSPQSSISSINVPASVASDGIFRTLGGADQFQNFFQNAMQNYTARSVKSWIQNQTVTNPPELLRRLIMTTTINFASSPSLGSDSTDITGLPKDFFLNDSALGGGPQGLGLNYSVPVLTLARPDFNAFVTKNQLCLVNSGTGGQPGYSQPGATHFAFFVPVPAFEDSVAIRQLITQKVVSSKFAAAVLMVDFTNPVFSAARSSLMKYANQITSGTADGADIPSQFAKLTAVAAAGQPPFDDQHPGRGTPEQQFNYYWSQTDWQAACQTQINQYLAAVGARIPTSAGASDYLTLAVSRGVQFAQDPQVGSLNEFQLLLPQSTLGNIKVQMLPDGTLGPLTSP